MVIKICKLSTVKDLRKVLEGRRDDEPVTVLGTTGYLYYDDEDDILIFDDSPDLSEFN